MTALDATGRVKERVQSGEVEIELAALELFDWDIIESIFCVHPRLLKSRKPARLVCYPTFYCLVHAVGSVHSVGVTIDKVAVWCVLKPVNTLQHQLALCISISEIIRSHLWSRSVVV